MSPIGVRCLILENFCVTLAALVVPSQHHTLNRLQKKLNEKQKISTVNLLSQNSVKIDLFNQFHRFCVMREIYRFFEEINTIATCADLIYLQVFVVVASESVL